MKHLRYGLTMKNIQQCSYSALRYRETRTRFFQRTFHEFIVEYGSRNLTST